MGKMGKRLSNGGLPEFVIGELGTFEIFMQDD